MREIKFRAWSRGRKEMAEVESIHFKGNAVYLISKYLRLVANLDETELMQFTGLQDKKGVDIYEGDIANHKDYECFGKVVFSDDELAFAFLVVTGSNNKGPTTEFEWLYEYADGLEVIGNITDNPELMEVRD